MSKQPADEKAIFLAAVEIVSKGERARFLDEACDGNENLRADLELLLLEHDREQPLLDTSDVAATLTQPLGDVLETQVGPYKLLQKVGEGGMGVVYRAEQAAPVQREVALKLIKPGMHTDDIISRFDIERQALAMMDHPNIAHVLDAGATANGRPYFVMDLVQGIPLTDFCDQHRLATRQRLEMFVTVCHAVQHAHQKGIIHRDIKPNNILVASQDGEPVPKIIDFGIAKAMDHRLTHEGGTTQIGQIVGTPLYMSPEQAELTGIDLDTRSDIYSLGVVLYELLTSTTPFERQRLLDAGLDEFRRLVREEEPPRPSTRVSTLGEAVSTISAHRRIDPRKLSELLKRELDWIVMRAMEKDRARRYQTAGEFADDIQRYLNDETVQACPPSAVYRFQKFAKRNRTAIIAGTAIVIALMIGTGIATWQSIRTASALHGEQQQRQRAEANFANAMDAIEQITLVATNDLKDVPQLQPVRRALLEKALTFYETFLAERGNDDVVQEETGHAHLRAGGIALILGANDDAEGHFRKAVKIFDRLREAKPREPQHRLNLSQSRTQLGMVLAARSNVEDAEALMQEALGTLQQLVGEFPKNRTYRSALAACQNNLAGLLWRMSRYEESVELARKYVEICEQLGREFTSDEQSQLDLGRAYGNLGTQLMHLHQNEEAEKALRASLDIRRRLVRDYPETIEYQAQLTAGLSNFGQFCSRQENYLEARKILEEATQIATKLAADSPNVPHYRSDVATCQINLGIAQEQLGQQAEAEQSYRSAAKSYGRLAEQFPKNVGYQYGLGMAYHALNQLLEKLGKYDEASEGLENATALWQELAENQPTSSEFRNMLALSHRDLATMQKNKGQRDLAEASLRQAILSQDKLATEYETVPDYRDELAGMHRVLGELLHDFRPAEALQQLRKSLDINQQLVKELPSQPGYRSKLGRDQRYVALMLQRQSQYDEAEKLHRASIETFEGLVHDFADSELWRRELATAYLELGFFLMLCSRFEEARSECRQAVEALQKFVSGAKGSIEVRQQLATVYRTLGELTAAEPVREAESAEYFGREMEIYDDLVANLADPLDSPGRTILRMRAEALARGQSWKKAAADLLRLTKTEPPDPAASQLLCIVWLSAGDTGAYRGLCAALLTQCPRDGDSSNLWWITSCCSLAPIDKDKLAQAVKLAEKSVTAAPENERNRMALARLLYRAERFEESVTLLEKTYAANPNESTALWLAMAQYRLGKTRGAQATYEQAREFARQAAQKRTLSILDELQLKLLRNEAEKLVSR